MDSIKESILNEMYEAGDSYVIKGICYDYNEIFDFVYSKIKTAGVEYSDKGEFSPINLIGRGKTYVGGPRCIKYGPMTLMRYSALEKYFKIISNDIICTLGDKIDSYTNGSRVIAHVRFESLIDLDTQQKVFSLLINEFNIAYANAKDASLKRLIDESIIERINPYYFITRDRVISKIYSSFSVGKEKQVLLSTKDKIRLETGEIVKETFGEEYYAAASCANEKVMELFIKYTKIVSRLIVKNSITKSDNRIYINVTAIANITSVISNLRSLITHFNSQINGRTFRQVEYALKKLEDDAAIAKKANNFDI